MSLQQQALPSRTVEAVAGLSAGFCTTLMAHPFDLFKLRLQLDTNRTSQWTAFKRIYSNLRLHSNGHCTTLVSLLYRGIGPNLVGSTAAWGLYFFFYRQYKDLFIHHSATLSHDSHLRSHHYLASAFLAGWSTSVLTNPIWVIKTRMLSTERSAPGSYKSVLDGVLQIYAREGLRGYYRGLLPALFNVSQGAVQMSLYDLIKRSINQHDSSSYANANANTGTGTNTNTNSETLSSLQYVYASATSKMISTCMFYPLQIIRSRMQITTQQLQSPIHVCIQMCKNEGFTSLYKGLPANLLRVLPATCSTFLIYEHVKRLLTTT